LLKRTDGASDFAAPAPLPARRAQAFKEPVKDTILTRGSTPRFRRHGGDGIFAPNEVAARKSHREEFRKDYNAITSFATPNFDCGRRQAHPATR